MIFNQDRLRKAREAGYSDDEIWEYASGYDQRMKKARDAGYSLEEVSSFFTPKKEEEAGLLPPVEEMFKPKPKEVGTFEGIANAARNAFASSQQALAVTGGVTPEEAKEISKIEFEKNARQVSPDYKEYQEAQGFDAVKAFARNPFEVTTNIVAEGLAGSLPALGAGLAAGGVGAAVAAPTVVGAPVGFLAGQVAGTFAGSLATEYGGKVLEELQGAGMDINNPESITEFFSKQELVDAAKEKALKRGVPIAAFDALSAGIGGKVGAITKAAFKTKTREAAAEMAVQAALGGGGEVAGSLVAGDKVDPKAVFAEVVGEVGPGAAEIGIGKIQQTFAERRKQEQIKRAAKVSQDLENNNAPLTADALKATVARNAVEEEKATIEETDATLAEEASKFAPPEDAITKQELKTQYAALSPEDLADTEATFRERLDDEDPEMRTFAQNALDAIAEVRAEQVTQAPPVEQRQIELSKGLAAKPELETREQITERLKKQEEKKEATDIKKIKIDRMVQEDAVLDELLGIDPESNESFSLTRAEKEQRLTPQQRTEYGRRMLEFSAKRLEEATATAEPTSAPAPSITPAVLSTEIQSGIRSGVASLDPDMRELYADQLTRKLEKKGSLTWQDVPQELNAAMDTASFSALKQALDTNPQEAINIIAGKPAAPTIVETAAPPAVVEPTAVAPAPTVEPTLVEPTPAPLAEPAPPAEVETAASLSRVADNTATDEEVVRLARQGLVNIQDGQNVITPRGEEVMQLGGAPLPRLTPEERAAEVAAVPAPAAIVEQAPAPKAPAPEDKTATIFNYEEKVAPIQERIDNRIDELVAGGMTFEQADNDPSVMALLEERLAVDRGAVNSYRNIVRTAFSEQGITQNDLTFNPAESIIEKVYAAPRTGDEGLIALISERGQEAFADDEATVKKLAEAIFKYRAEAEGFSPEELLGPRSNLTDAGKQSRVDEARSQAQSIHNKIKASLIEGAQPVQPVQPAALPARAALPAPTPVTTPPVTEAVTPAPAAPAEAAPVGIAVGNRVKTKTTPQSFVVEEVLPQSAREAELKEQYYSIRNERTGEVQTVEAGDIKIVRGKGVRKMAAAPAISQIWATPPQEISSAATSINQRQMPATFRRVKWQSGTRNADIGGGRFDNATEYLAESGVENVIYDPYNRTQESNQAAVAKISGGQSDTATVNNVLNVIAEPESRDLVIRQAADAIKPNGKAYFLIYEGNKKGVGSPTASGWQENRKTEAYVSEIRKHFGSVIRKGNLIVAENPLKPAIVLRQVAEIRAEEKYTPVPEANRYTFREASGRAIRFFGGEKPENFVIVNNSTDPDYEFKAGYDPETGEIILNRAYIQRGENIEDILTHELGHYIYSDPQFQADFQDFLESMPDEARAEIDRIVNEGYNKETNEVQIEEREVMAFTSLIRRTKRGLTAWEKLKDTIKKIINRFLGTNITLSDQGAMAVFNVGYKRFKSGERIIREMKKGTLRTAPEGMTQMDRDYLAAVERGDMETAQRMVDEAAKRQINSVDGIDIEEDWTPKAGEEVERVIFGEVGDTIEANEIGNLGFINTSGVYGLHWGDTDYWKNRLAEDYGRDVGEAKKIYLTVADGDRVVEDPQYTTDPETGEKATAGILVTGRRTLKRGVDFRVEGEEYQTDDIPKSADPVTYDDAGNVIPLSQRFRPTSPDIRRMAPEPAPAPEAVVEEAPAERPKRRTKMQNIIDISTGVKRPKTKLTVNEMTALKDQIKMRARRRREDKRSQREFAEELTKEIREMTIRGKVRPAQLRAIMSVALRTQFDNEASINAFNKYADKVIENANYEKDISDALSTIKRAKQLSKGKKGSSRIRHRLAELARFNPRDIEPESMEPKRVEIDGEIVLEKPISVAEYTAVLKEYMGSLGPVTEEGFRVIPEAEIVDFLERMAAQYDANVEERRKAAFAKKIQQALENKALLPSELESLTKDSPEEYEQNLKKKQEDKRLKIENAITDLAMDAQSALVTYQPLEMTSDKKEVLDFMRAVNVGDIPAGERKEFVLIANNILVNNDFSGSKKFTSIAKGQIGAMKAAEDAKSVKRNNAMLTFLDGYISEKLTRAINLSIQSIADTFRNIAGKEGAPRLLFLMGMGDLARGQATANKLNDEIANGIRDRYTQIEEETGQQISDKQGMFSMGVAGTLIQIQPDETEAEGISRIRKLILENIAVMENSPLLEDRRNVQFVKKALAEVDADSVDGILENLNRLHPANYKALDFLMNTVLPEQKETLKEHDELFNNQTDNYNNPFYLPIRYRRTMVPVRTPEDIITSIYGGTPTPKQAANTIKRQKYSTLPRDVDGAPMLFDFNLTKNVLDSLSSQITAAYTNPYWQQIVSFLKAPPASDAVGGTRNLSFVNERLGKLAQSRTRRAYEMDGVSRILDTVANVSRRLGIGLALGGYGQFIKQLPDQLMTTLVNVKDPQLMSDSMADLLSGRANAVLRQFSIGERGEIAGGTTWTNQMEGNFDKVRRFINSGNWVKAADAFERFNNVWLFALKKSDYLAAGSGWLAYYRKYLRDRGAEFKNWDEEAALLQEDNQLRIEAALYAEQMVDMYQGSSDPTKMATLSQRGQNGWENLAKTIFIPFFSFVIQQRSRIFSDARDIAFGDSDQKKSGASGLAGTLLGILAFHSARRFALPALAGVGASAVYALLGVDMDEPDEEKQKEEANRIWRQFSGEVLSNIFFGGFGDFTEKKFIDSVNYASYLIEVQIGNENVLNDKGELISFDKYQKERSPLYRYTGPGSENNLGMLDIMPGQIGELKKRIEEMTSEELAESLTPEERRVLFVAGLSEWLYTMRLNDADIARMIRRMNKDVIEQAEEREKARKRLQEIYQ